MPARITPDSTVVASEQQMSRDVGEETVILGIEEGMYYGLDQVASRIWSLLQEPCRVSDICDVVVAEYEVTPEECQRDVVALLGQLADQRLIEVAA